MTINTEDLLNSILESVGRIDYIHPVDIPNIDLYMDQVTTFMEEQLSSTKRYEDDKILTKTMINNYAKNNLQLSDPAFFHLTDFFIDTFHVKFRIHSKIFVCQWL